MAYAVERRSDFTKALILLLVGLLVPSCVSAQQPIIPLQLSFSDPGARSMAFGGAFVALADDATAAFANPAGLTQLLRPEASIEIRNWSYSTPYTVSGRVEGLPSGYGLDTEVGIKRAPSDETTTGLSFLSFAVPRGDWSFALYRHEYGNLEFSGATQGLFGGGTNCCQIRHFDEQVESRLDFLSYAFSAGYRISDNFNIGFGLAYHDASLESTATQFNVDDDSLESIFGPNSYLPEQAIITQRLLADDNDWTLTAGILWDLSERWRIGGVYRQGAEALLAGVVTAGPAGDFGVPPGTVLAEGKDGPVEFPDIYGLGLAYRSVDGRLTLSFQWDHVEYSDIPRSLALDDQTIDDANELHLGAEYVFLDSTPIIALRFGSWREPDHQMRAVTDDAFTRALMPRGKDEMHYAAGLGVAMDNFQIDFAVDFGDRADTVSLSAIYGF